MNFKKELCSIAPTLEGERILMRAHQLSDFEQSCEMWDHPDIVRYTPSKSFDRSEAWGRLLRYAGHWMLLGFGKWVVVDKKTGVLIGDVGFFDGKREVTPSLHGFAEAGWVISPKFHGRGYAREAVELALTWLNDVKLFSEVHCLILPENTASLALAQRVGFKEYAQGTHKDEPTVFLKQKLI